MLDVFSVYWPYLIAVHCVGFAMGWWYQGPRSADDATAWLERGPDEP
jgi:hypothetical protein